jgi:hypothetical protein
MNAEDLKFQINELVDKCIYEVSSKFSQETNKDIKEAELNEEKSISQEDKNFFRGVRVGLNSGIIKIHSLKI